MIDWVQGDATGLLIPAHIAALRESPENFLTRAFQASGTITASNRVTAITRFDEIAIGGTGAKLILSVAYAEPTEAPTELFCKFSRDFKDAIRDKSRYMLEAEIRFANLSRMPGFPITVPRCAFADYQAETGTGLLITERIFYGENGVEPHYPKCYDQELPRPLEHYRAVIKALARLAGTHKAGRLPAGTEKIFPFDREAAIAADPFPYNTQRLLNRVSRYAAFAKNFSQMLPDNIRSPAFIEKWREEMALYSENERKIQEFLADEPDFIALCHWNANIDNIWFWRDHAGQLQCGLLDWGRVGQMNIARTIYGSISGAEPEFWAEHTDELLTLFAETYQDCGAPRIDVDKLRTHLDLVTATMGIASLMDVPPIVQMEFPDLAEITGPYDPRFLANENARVMLHVLTMFLNRWDRQDFGRTLKNIL